MAIKPQLLAATIVSLIVSSANAQQFGPPGGNVLVAPPANQPAYGAPGAVFGPPPGMTTGQGTMQLVSAPPVEPMNGSASTNFMGPPTVPNTIAMNMDPASAPFAPGGPIVGENPMAYGPGPVVPPGYPMMAQPGLGPVPNGYGGFPAPEPVTPRWYFRGEAVWLVRNNPNDRNLTFYNNFSNDHDRLNARLILNTDDIAFGLTPGMRLTLGRYITDRTAIEGAFYGTNNWDERTGTPAFPSANGAGNGAGPLFPYWGAGAGPFNTSAFLGSNQQFASYHSSFDSAELGIRQWFTPSMSALLGFRYINVRDQFQLTAINEPPNEQVGYYRTWTTNNLVGLQFGTEYTHDLFARWLFFSIEGKAGAFLNFADQKNLLFNTGTTYDQRSARETQFSSMFDLSLALTALLGDHLTVRGGYTFLFLDGLALATDQLDMNPTMTNSRDFIADKGTMTLQGPFVGAELAW